MLDGEGDRVKISQPFKSCEVVPLIKKSDLKNALTFNLDLFMILLTIFFV